jgi:hypothetical protein
VSYREIAQGLEDENRRVLALDLAEKLDLLNACMKRTEVDKTYQSNMRLFLAAQKQFANLLPPQMAGAAADALAEFNSL